jgi:uncharacterized protein (TIGR00730 family)
MRICVVCGSSCGSNGLYMDAARKLGTTLAERNIDLIYGGGRVGLMGVLADATVAAQGFVIGVMPQSLVEREIQHRNLNEFHVVNTMHERKSKMAELADGFVSLPGGAGTLEEILEQWTWAQLGIHQKPCAFLNVNGYFDPFRAMVKQMVGEGFLEEEYASMLIFAAEPVAIVEAFRAYSPPPAKWGRASAFSASRRPPIKIVAAVIQAQDNRILLVRKKGTRTFMQPGGKLHESESHCDALQRELKEELTCDLRPDTRIYLGTFRAPAANESGYMVEAALYRVDVTGSIHPAAEIEEVVWVDPNLPNNIDLAPLTSEVVFPLIRQKAR